MKISFWIPAVVLYMVRGAFSNSVQVGTVLFTPTDLVKNCWTENDRALLKARLIMQDVLPDPDCIDFSNEEAVAILLDYFHSCYEVISKSTYGKLQNLMYLALSDAVGGYLRAYVLPFTRKAYYAGQTSYEDAKKLFQLYDDIRVFLKTNGVGWAEPRTFAFKKFHVKPLVITGGELKACKELYVIEREGKFHSFGSDLGSREHVKPKRRRFAKTKKQLSFYNFINSCSGGGGEMFFQNWNRTGMASEGRQIRKCSLHDMPPGDESTTRVLVPLPVLDDCATPHSIAVPFVKQPFRNLKTGCSAFVLEDYYTAVVKCFIAKGNSRTDIKTFNREFYIWLESQVLPHLDEEQWYPGFGGVLRVVQTIKNFGVEAGGSDPVLHDIAFMFKDGTEFEVAESFKEKGRNKVRDVAVEGIEEEFPNPQRHIITAIITVSMIWVFIFCTFAFYCQATRGHRLLYEGQEPCSSQQECHLGQNDSRDQGRNLNFQFLVKFFKRNNEVQNQDSDNAALRLAKHGETTCIPATMDDGHSYNEFSHRRWDTGDQSLGCRPARRHPHENFCFSALLPGHPYLTSFDKPQKFDGGSGGEVKYLDKSQEDRIQMLWKKPSLFFGDPDPSKYHKWKKCETLESGSRSEDLLGQTTTDYCSSCLAGGRRVFHYTTNSSSMLDEMKGFHYVPERQTSTCNCSENCPFAHTTTTSSTQLAGKLSSATMNFFEEIIAKHKARKSSIQDSTAESETECCTLSETDY